MLSLLVPSDPLRPSRPDDHFAWRADAAAQVDVPVALVDTSDLDDPRAVRRMAAGASVVLHGWIMTAEEYVHLDRAVRRLDAALLTSPDDYARAHHLPGWYDTFAALTPRSAWVPGEATPELLERTAQEVGDGAYVVKDWVKSRKHEWATACFAPDAAAVPAVAAEMLRLVGDDLAGGIVVRAYTELVGAEARVWWVDGEPAVVTAHPDTPDAAPDDVLLGAVPEVAGAVRDLGCPFVTTDLARRADGGWCVVEVGDGQVSDFPRTGDHGALLDALGAAALRRRR